MLTFNVGDSRTIMISKENGQALTTDHTLEEFDEVDRIEDAGGVITYENGKRPRIGGLLTTRTLGDMDAHAQGVSEIPEIICRQIPQEDRCIISATDGVFEVLNNNEVTQIVRPFHKKALEEVKDKSE